MGIIAGVLLLTTAAWAQAGPKAAPKAAELLPSDCVKCHEKEPQDIDSNGGAHKTQVSCVDCHVGHPQW